MDGFSYNNIFDTKGIEYLVIIGFLIILIPFWLILTKHVNITGRVRRVLGILTTGVLRIPQGLYYSKNHTWTHLERTGSAFVGLDDMLLHITGVMNFHKLKSPGEKIKKGDMIAELEHNGNVLKIFSPVSGDVIETNPILTRNPGMLNDDPYREGWMYKVKPGNWIAETSGYFLAAEAAKWMEQELTRFRDFLVRNTPDLSHGMSRLVLQDGGALRDQALSELPAEIWQKFQDDFLSRTDQG